MTTDFRGGNSRILAKSLDQLENPMAVLDRKGFVLFANKALCSMAGVEATQLVGKRCSWQIAPDDTPHASILTALAPPAGALKGKVMTRQLTMPVVFGSTATGQLFVPILDEDQLVHMTWVVLGAWEEIQGQVPTTTTEDSHQRRQNEQTLVRVRSRWETLDGLLPLVGESPAIELAMTRAQLAIANPCHVFILGPSHVGKAEVARGIFLGRLKQSGLPRIAGQLFPVDCSVLNAELLDGMLEVFAGRLRPDTPAAAQHLVLEHVDQLSSDSVQQVNAWIDRFGSGCFIVSTSTTHPEQLAQRDGPWQKLVGRLAAVEIHIPPLRERREDIAALAQHALASYCQRSERALLTLSAEAIDLLTAYTWPQNLSQLTDSIEEAVEHAVLSSAIHVNHLPLGIRTFPGSAGQPDDSGVEPIRLDEILLDVERIILQRALKLSPRNRAQAARWLGISRPRLLRRISQLGLDSAEPTETDTEQEEETP